MITLLYALSFLGITALCFFMTDMAANLYIWQSRIHIGRWNDRKVWQQAIEKKTRKWLRRSPTVKITDESRLILWDIIRGKYRSKTIQSWQDAGMLFALSEEDAKEYVLRHPGLFKKRKPETDHCLLAYILKKKKALPTEIEQCFKNTVTEYEKEQKTIPYRQFLPNIRFVDTIGMVCPFLYLLGFDTLAIKQIEEYEKCLWMGIFPPHAYDTETGSPLGVFDWARGLGWYILGLTETCSLPDNRERILKLSENMLHLQRKDGGFCCMAFNKNERFEASGTALAGLLFVKAFLFSDNKVFLDAALAAEKALMKATRRDGTVDFAQGDTKGIGFYSRTFDRMPFAQGMTLYLSRQIDALKV